MQNIHAIGDRLFGGGGGDRRLRPHHHHQNLQALKCPRCDSINTKFCYYNNYNLSQPRHFCKSCRRYWTKGGVLRNVPIGGGCRKSRRSKQKSSSSDAAAAAERKLNSHSSSESSTVTASTAPTPAPAPAPAPASTASSSASDYLRIVNLPESTNSCLLTASIDQSSDSRMLPGIRSFASLMTSSTDTPFAGFNMTDMSTSAYRLHHQEHGAVLQNQSLEQQEISAGMIDRVAQMDLSGLQNRGNNGELEALGWNSGGDQGLFDLIGTVDQAYWGQTQWTENDQPLYLP
ncbi:hypothetical protein NMG60_11005820 [Bertholletia excelsa]